MIDSNMKSILGKFVALPVLVLILAISAFNGILFYNEAGFSTHVRTIFGEEKIVTDVGYATKWFGRSTPWKQAQTLQGVICQDRDSCRGIQEDTDNSGISVNTPIVFLGNVDASVEFSTRFRLPQGEQFLKIAQEYRTPENFMNTAIAPAVKETLQSTASLMSADDYFAGARSEFGSEFESQLKNGIYITKRVETQQSTHRVRNQPQELKSGGDLSGVIDDTNTRAVVEVKKVTDSEGKEKRKEQQFRTLGVDVVEARVTNIDPNPQYKQRMVKVQQALAELAVARQNRLKEEEEKLLVTARGEKQVEEKRQETLRDQIEQTTKAETEKQLAIINAERQKQSAEIEKDTAQILFDKNKIEASSIKVTADADAYARKVLIESDGGLQKKLDAMVAINKNWADAAAKAPVPSVVMGGSSNGSSTSRQSEFEQMMGILAAKAAKDLTLDMKIKE